MEKHKRKQNGITLISLVISIIVMLILAGVTLNAAIGDNGIISQAQYATFLNEMAAVEEAVALWKINQKEDAIPANGLCQEATLSVASNKNAERLNGEVGYYRVWSMSETMPNTSIFASADEFNGKFETEMLYFPAGVQDLYYLDNDALGIDSKKEYIIDAVNSMVYSTTGITIKGVRVYSTAMAKAIMNGTLDVPLFAEAEVSGTGAEDEILAGNVQDEYLPDGTKNPDYNPYGFEIIASINSNNLYKLYNNGDLYAKGVKGTQMNSSAVELSTIDSTKWDIFSVPEEIGSYKKVIQGCNTMYVIDSNNDLWAWGTNGYNKLGLTENEQIEYTGREPVKLNVAGKSVEKVWDSYYNCFVLTKENGIYELYGMGDNANYQLGLGHNDIVNSFQKIDVKTPEKIENMIFSRERHFIIIKYNDNTFFSSGRHSKAIIGCGVSGDYKKFNPIWDGYVYLEEDTGDYAIDAELGYNADIDIDQDIKNVVTTSATSVLVLKNDNMVLYSGTNPGWVTDNNFTSNYLSEFSDDIGKDVKEIYSVGYGYIIQKENGEIYGANGVRACVGFEETNREIKKIELPEELIDIGIKEIFTVSYVDIDSAVYYLDNNGDVWASSNTAKYVGGVAKPEGIEKLDLPKIKSFYEKDDLFQKVYVAESVQKCSTQLFLGEDGNYYYIGDDALIYRNEALQKKWTKIASNVKKVSLGENQTIAYIERETNNVFVAGDDSRILAQNTSIQEKIPNFIKLENELIEGKVKDIYFPCGQMVVLTTDNELYSTGIYSLDGSYNWPNDRTPGWEEDENYYTFVKLMDDVSMFNGSEYCKILISNNELYLWGMHNSPAIRIPTKLDLASKLTNLEVSNVKKITTGILTHQILDNDGNYYATFRRQEGGSTIDWKQYNSDLNNEKVIDVVEGYRTSTVIVLTENGNLYGRGDLNILGVGKTTGYTEDFIKLPIENVIQITRGNGFFVAVKEDGTVWGTGTNQYGVLGRWIGIDRTQPNSRYRTAFDWVECPELEI